MKVKVRVVSPRNLPAPLPVVPGLVLWLVLDHIHAGGVVRGVAWTLFALWALLCVISLALTDHVNIREVLEAADKGQP